MARISAYCEELVVIREINTETDPIVPFESVYGGYLKIDAATIPAIMWFREDGDLSGVLVQVGEKSIVLRAKFDTFTRFTNRKKVVVLPLVELQIFDIGSPWSLSMKFISHGLMQNEQRMPRPDVRRRAAYMFG